MQPGTSYKVGDEFFACPTVCPHLFMDDRGELCCRQHTRVADERIREYQTLQSPFGYLVLVPKDFVGD